MCSRQKCARDSVTDQGVSCKFLSGWRTLPNIISTILHTIKVISVVRVNYVYVYKYRTVVYSKDHNVHDTLHKILYRVVTIREWSTTYIVQSSVQCCQNCNNHTRLYCVCRMQYCVLCINVDRLHHCIPMKIRVIYIGKRYRYVKYIYTKKPTGWLTTQHGYAIICVEFYVIVLTKLVVTVR